MAGLKYTEEELLNLLKNKDGNAFSYLYDNYSAALYGVILRILKQDEGAAEDILQDAFMKIWSKIAMYDASKGTLFTWMLNIARNSAIDALRTVKRVEVFSIDEKVSAIDKEYQSGSKEDSIGLKAVINKLKAEHKVIIDMAYFGGYTQEEIANSLNMPLGTVKTRTRAALMELRKMIN